MIADALSDEQAQFLSEMLDDQRMTPEEADAMYAEYLADCRRSDAEPTAEDVEALPLADLLLASISLERSLQTMPPAERGAARRAARDRLRAVVANVAA